MKPSVSDQGDDGFFKTGLQKYLDAASAVAMFEREVQRRVKSVVSRQQPALVKLFGEDWSLKDYQETGIASTPPYLCLGQQVVFQGCRLYFYVWFGRDEKESPSLCAAVLLWRERVTLLSQLWTAVEAVRGPQPEVEKSRFYLEGEVPSHDWPSCEKALDAVIRDWIKLWEKFGGLPKYLLRKAS